MSINPNEAASVGDEARIVLELQARVLESVGVGRALEQVLEQLCHLVEGIVPGAICSTMVLTPSGSMDVLVAPSASKELIEALNGLVPSDVAGSCGTAVYQCQPVYVCDTSTDDRWRDFREFAETFGIKSCWSMPIYSKNGSVLGAFGISHSSKREPQDLHKELLQSASWLAGLVLDRERTDADRQRLAERRLQQHKMEAIGQLASGVAHEFNNMLAAVLGNTELLLMDVQSELPDSCRAPLQQIRDVAEHAAALTQQLLTFGRKSTAELSPVSLNAACTQTEPIITRLVNGSVKINTRLAAEEPVTLGNYGELQQVITNLVLNARDAMPNGGTITIRTSHVDVDGLSNANSTNFLSGPYVCLSVQDEGIGMTQEQSRRIFEPFFTTKPAGKGTGLGLATVFAVVNRLGGHIVVDSEPGEGTTVNVILQNAQRAATGSHGFKVSAVGGTETVLVCDDVEAVRRVIGQQLESVGYHVLSAQSGREALEMAQGLSQPVDALLTDVEMPEMSGQELAHQFEARWPGTPVLYMSGFGESCVGDDSNGSRPFLQKPIDVSTLLGKVREALDRRASLQPTQSVSG